MWISAVSCVNFYNYPQVLPIKFNRGWYLFKSNPFITDFVNLQSFPLFQSIVCSTSVICCNHLEILFQLRKLIHGLWSPDVKQSSRLYMLFHYLYYRYDSGHCRKIMFSANLQGLIFIFLTNSFLNIFCNIYLGIEMIFFG